MSLNDVSFRNPSGHTRPGFYSVSDKMSTRDRNKDVSESRTRPVRETDNLIVISVTTG
jgi:hypothetical protein